MSGPIGSHNGLAGENGRIGPDQHRRPRYRSSTLHETLKTAAGIGGNILEWYDFAVFGFFSDILGVVFFPRDQPEELSVMESFAVFGGAFLMRPIGGLIIGYIGDVSGRKNALEISIFLMALATTLMGCLPTYEQIGGGAILLLLMVRMLQGLSVGGQLMSSLVFTLEGHPENRWGLYGSFVMAAGNLGTFLGGIVAYGLRSTLTTDQLLTWGWRIPFLSGILITFCGLYLRYACADDEVLPGHAPVPTNDEGEETHGAQEDEYGNPLQGGGKAHHIPASTTVPPVNPLRFALSTENRRSLIASAMVPVLWGGGFYLSFVWLPIYMQDLVVPPVHNAFKINSCSLLLLGIWFPVAGMLSDIFGRKAIMTFGGVSFAILGPLMIYTIGNQGGHDETFWKTFFCQSALGVSLSCWGSPMCAWLVESFDPQARLTSVSIGYNIAQALAGGMSPFFATLLVNTIGKNAPGLLLLGLATVSLIGLWCVAPASPTLIGTTATRLSTASSAPSAGAPTAESSLELKEII